MEGVAISDQDDGGISVYPKLPKMMNIFSKYGSLAKMRGEDRFTGRKLFSIMERAGLSPITVYPFPIYATQQNPEMLKMLVSVPVQIVESSKDYMIKQGMIGAEDYPEAVKEVQEFLDNRSFRYGSYFPRIGEGYLSLTAVYSIDFSNDQKHNRESAIPCPRMQMQWELKAMSYYV